MPAKAASPRRGCSTRWRRAASCRRRWCSTPSIRSWCKARRLPASPWSPASIATSRRRLPTAPWWRSIRRRSGRSSACCDAALSREHSSADFALSQHYARRRRARFKKKDEPMGTFDDFFIAFGNAFAGFNTFVVDKGQPVFDVGLGGLGNTNGVQGAVEAPQHPPELVGGVYGAGVVQPGVIGFSQGNDGVE